jgi:S-adenosylmethionine/arginine decarboxylase-like enzyme
MTKAKTEYIYDHKGTHATADILLNSYPENVQELFQESLKYCNLNIIAQKIHQFTDEAATGVFILAESSADFHEYPEVENGYICVSVFTCGEEGEPKAAIEHFLSLLDVKDANVKCFNRGHFEQSSASVTHYDFVNTEKKEYEEVQEKLASICKSLTAEQVQELQKVIDFTAFSDYS